MCAGMGLPPTMVPSPTCWAALTFSRWRSVGRWWGHGRLAVAAETGAGGLQAADRGHVVGRLGEAEHRHVAVDDLAMLRVDEIGLVPEADAAVGVANDPVEAPPGGQVRLGGAAGEALEVVKGAPVLHQSDTSPVDDRLGVEEALVGI